MSSLFEIIEAVKRNERPDYDELRYAFLALETLHNFTSHDLRKFHSASGKKMHPSIADMWVDEDFQRQKRTMALNPKEWLGWDNDPANPDYQKRRGIALRLFEKVSAQVKSDG